MNGRQLLDQREIDHAPEFEMRIARDPNRDSAFRNSDGTYNVRDMRSNAIAEASNGSPFEYNEDEYVLVANVGGSGRHDGAGLQILRPARGTKRGLAGAAVASSRIFGGVAVLDIDPYPLELVRGGDAGTQYIRGFFLSQLPFYSSPEIVNDVDPIETPTAITSLIRATEDALEGYYDVTIQGRTFENAIRVLPAEAPPLGDLWIVGQDVDTGSSTIGNRWFVTTKASDDFSGAVSLELYSTDTLAFRGILKRAGKVHILAKAASGSYLLTFDTVTGALTTSALLPFNVAFNGTLAHDGTQFVTIATATTGGSPKLYGFSQNGLTVTHIASLTSDSFVSIIVEDGYYWLGGDGPASWQIPVGGGTAIAFAAAYGPLVSDGTYIYSNSLTGLQKLRKSDLAVIDTLAGSFGSGLTLIGANLYTKNLSDNTTRKIETATLTSVGSIATSFGVYGTHSGYITDGTNLFFSSQDSTLVRDPDLVAVGSIAGAIPSGGSVLQLSI